MFTETPSRVAASSIRCLSAFREPERDAGVENASSTAAGASASWSRTKTSSGSPPAIADLDAAAVELRVETSSAASPSDLLEAPGEGGLERDREQLGRVGGGLVTESRDAGEVFAERLDVTVDLHGCTMTSQ